MTLSDIDFGVVACDQAMPAEQLSAELMSFSGSKRDSLKTTAIPTRKTESWKYSAKRLKLAESYPVASNDTNGSQTHTYQASYKLDCYTVVISNNQLQSDLPEISGISLKSFADLSDSEGKQVIAGVIAQSEHLVFANANAAYLQNGLYLNIEKNALIDKPVKVVFQHKGLGNSFPRLFVNLESGSSLTLIEEVVSETNAIDTTTSLINSVCDIQVGDNAKLQYLRMNLDQAACKHLAATGIALQRDARLESYCMYLGNDLSRHDLLVKMLAPGAECDLNGICVTKDQQHIDAHTCIEHIAPNCTSNETYRCIADNKSQIVFNGRIYIHPHAQKTSGSMSNKNLLLSSEAEIDSKPELEIYADDVKCAHGTTIGQLDETELYYLQTRGIPHEQAKLMLTLGFVLEVVRATPIESIAEFWEQQLSDILSFEA